MFIGEPTLDVFLRGLLLTSLAMIWVVMLVRVNGLRSFSKMTNFDFDMTVAVGSLLAGASQSTSWSAFAQTLVQKSPVVQMRDGVIIDEALAMTRVAKDDLIAKLREENVLDLSRVRAVILETTGDVSVLHGDMCAEELLQGTKRLDR